MYFDHPTMSEGMERPERSLRDLAAVLESGAVWRDDPKHGAGLYAEARVFPTFREPIAAMAPHIGTSIRARGEGHEGLAEGKRGTIIDTITQGLSVDFVTKAGRGGQVLALAEAAGLDLGEAEDLDEAGTMGQWFESRIHSSFTMLADDMYGDGRLTRAERIALSSAIGDALDAFTSAVEEKAPQLFDRNRWDNPPDETTPMEESAMNLSTGEAPPSSDPRVCSEEARGEVRKEVEKELEEAKATADTATKENADLKTAIAIGEARREAGELVNKTEGLPDATKTAIVEAAAAKAVVGEDGKLDKSKLAEAVAAETTAQVTYLESVGVKVGGGQVTGLGAGATTVTGTTTTTTVAESAAETAALEKQFQALGLSEAEAKHAANR